MAIDANKDTDKNRNQPKGKQRVISNPNDIAGLVMMQIDNINAKKDDLTIAIKGLTDTAKQLVRAYAQQQQVITKLAERVKKLEDKPTNAKDS